MSAQENHDESVSLSEGSIHNSARAIINDKSRAFFIATLLAINTVATIAMFFEWRNAATESRLKQYDLDWFKSQDFAALKGEVAVHDKLISGLQIQKYCTK
jgi:hypothetical protein